MINGPCLSPSRNQGRLGHGEMPKTPRGAAAYVLQDGEYRQN